MTQPRELTDAERRSIAALKRVAAKWPRTLTLASMDGSLSVMSSDDTDFAYGSGVERSEGILADIHGIPNTGGGW